MKDLFMFLMINMVKLGRLKVAHYYGEDFATVNFEADNKEYTINISCEEKKEISE